MADLEESPVPKKRQKLEQETTVEGLENEEIATNIDDDTDISREICKNSNTDSFTITNSVNSNNLKLAQSSQSCSGFPLVDVFDKGKDETATVSRQVQRTELDCGISEYISSHTGFKGTLKQRYSDFLVNERDLEGNTVHLTNHELPVEYVKEKLEISVLSPEAIEKLENLAKGEDKIVKVVVEVEDEKEKRTVVHREIREKFPMLESDTCEIDGHKAIRAFHHVPNDKFRRKTDWPKERGEYCHFLLYKENKDTMQAINLLAKCTKVKPDRFSYAGTKDGRAVTVQRVSVFRVDVKNLLGLNNVLKNISLGNFEYKKQPLKLGDLTGNSFVIVLRNVSASEEQVKTAITSVRDTGFINYYGLQRFGSGESATHDTGLCLLKSQWSEAVDHILAPRHNQNTPLAKACEHYRRTKNAAEAWKLLEGKRCLESFLLEGLSKSGNDFVNSLKGIPRNTRLMYVHAYQSYVWNKMVSRRVKEYGLKPIVGDLVYDRSTDNQSGKNPADTHSHGRCNDVTVKMLTQVDLDSGVYSIHNVVMPLPGYDIVYPGHNAKNWYKSMLLSDGLDINDMRRKVKDYSLSGAYRNIIVRPDHVKWAMLRYNDPAIPLALTDLARSRGDPEPASEPDGKYEALRIELSLPSSSYATMAVREILKTDTSALFQSSLNEH